MAGVRRTPERLQFRAVNFDNRLKNMLKTSQDRLVRAIHCSPESLFFLFFAGPLEFTNHASGKGAD